MLPRKHKLTRVEIGSLFEKGGLFNTNDFSIKYRLENSPKNNKFAVIVGKKVSKLSVRRHKIKRNIIGILDKSEFGRGKNGFYCAILVKRDVIFDKNLILQAISGILNKNK
jgi:ribonuclease P protein component